MHVWLHSCVCVYMFVFKATRNIRNATERAQKVKVEVKVEIKKRPVAVSIAQPQSKIAVS